jgi:hypothetical protein
MSKRQNSCTLNIGGAERTLKFSMNTEELYLYEKQKLVSTNADLNNPYTQSKIIVLCALLMGDKRLCLDEATNKPYWGYGFNNLPEDFSIDMVGDWMGECEDEKINDVIEFAETSMGFILSAEQRTLSRLIQHMKEIAPEKYQEIMSKMTTGIDSIQS